VSTPPPGQRCTRCNTPEGPGPFRQSGRFSTSSGQGFAENPPCYSSPSSSVFLNVALLPAADWLCETLNWGSSFNTRAI